MRKMQRLIGDKFGRPFVSENDVFCHQIGF